MIVYMLELLQFFIENLVYIIIGSIIFLSLMVLISMLDINFSDIKEKQIKKIVTIESIK